ncbi:MAG: hypothetical protein AAF800_02735 [Planctomycetota bacterium]
MRELTLPAPLLLLPGLGADGRLFAPQRDALGEAVQTPGWIAPASPNEDLCRYAERWAASINETVAGFDKDRPWFLGGMSMGGMIALEMLPFLDRPPAGVFLISSCRATLALPRLIRLGSVFTGRMPAGLLQKIIRWMAVPFAVRDGADDDVARRLVEMAKASDPEHLQWAIGAVAEWTYPGPRPPLGDAPAPPVFQAHGRHDWLIPLREDDCDLVIDRGRHLINASHAKTVNRWLYDHVTRLCGIDESAEPRVEDPDDTVRRRPELAARF